MTPANLTDEELDALVATEVMGWEKRAALPEVDINHPLYWFDADGERQKWVYGWFPSTSIADAWEVVEKFGYYESNNCAHQHTWYLEQMPVQAGQKFAKASAPTAPRAICLAALRAVGWGWGGEREHDGAV